ncbi:TPA: efflux RND transporter periplasmic adaptor subunit [Pseudomonas aeruginosa]
MSRIRCERCARPASHCLCALIPSLPSRTRVLVLQHPSEVGHALNTAGLAVLGLRNAELRVGERFAEETWRVPGYRACLLFPGEQARALAAMAAEAAGEPLLLVVPDGTWRKARKLLHLNPALAALPRVSLAEGMASRYRLRKAPGEGALSTIDDRAVVAALEQAQASRASNQAQLKSAEQDLQRYRSLYAERAVSRQLLDQQQATVDQLRATLKANDATINAERVRLSYTRITSPVSGKVGIRNVDVGNLVRVGDSLGLFSVTQIAPISVVFSLQQEQLPQLQALLGGEAAVRAYSRDGGSALGEGRLLTIDNQIDSSTGTIRVRASFDNRQARLWPGQFVAVSLHTGVRRDQLVLSSKAVRRGLEGNFVYRVAADRVEAVPVRVLQDIDGLSVVEGLASGDQVVVDGHSRLMPGALVDIQEPRPSLAQAAERQP